MTTIDQLGMGHDESGLYTTKTQSRPEVQLAPSADGTFLFPPTEFGEPGGQADLRSYVNFWMTAPISDGVLTNISAGYADLVRRQKIVDGEAWAAQYDAENRRSLTQGSESSMAAAAAARAVAYDEYFAEWHKFRPERIKAGAARSIARAGQLYFYSSSLSSKDSEELYTSTMNINSEEKTVYEIAFIYRLGELRDYFQDPDATAAERLEDLRQELRRMQKVG